VITKWAVLAARRTLPARSESGWFEDTARKPRAFVKKPPAQTRMHLLINIYRMVVLRCHGGSQLITYWPDRARFEVFVLNAPRSSVISR
jgi:hypothetical protein